MHDVRDGLDQQLLDFVSRLETACLLEVSRPGALEQLAHVRPAVLQEPTLQQLVHVARAGCIVVGRLSATSRLNVAGVCKVMETFALDQVEGLSTFAPVVGRSGVALAVRREQQLSRLLTCEAASSGSVRVTEEMGETLARVRVLHQLVVGVVAALGSALGTLARLHGWDAHELTHLVQTAHDGVRAGEEAAHEETRTKR
ncbi:MAG TPA: hypothetical protein PK156_33065 [Polyangium sp.]|nr:hypothetical protein [Polyangium sp.]